MSVEPDVFTSSPSGRRERPWLLPSNRRLRHLLGLSVRNLTLTPTNRPRSKTIDDDNLPHTLKSPAKILAQKEGRGLQHSRSSTGLSDLSSPKSKSSSLNPSDASSPNGGQQESGVRLATRPPLAKLRRRSTLQWTGASPRARQKKLEDVTAARMVSTWFSLHCSGIDDPVYISEVIPKAMNPSFRFFDLDALGPLVTRLDETTVKFWAKTEKSTEYTLLVELQVNLRSLQFIGKSLENFRHPLPPNCMIFHLKDGMYTSFTDLPPSEPIPSFSLSKPSKQGQEPQFTSSYDALMRLANLDDCIQDALSTREKLESQITSILSSNAASLSAISTTALTHEEQSTTKRALATERKRLRATIKKREDLLASLASRRAAMASGRTTQRRALSDLHAAQSKLAQSRALLHQTHTSASAQIARICEDLSTIYPVEPLPAKPLSFTIRGLHLPNSSSLSSTATPPEEIAAALGHVAQLVYSLSFYLSTPLPFPIKPFASRSFIQDPIASTIPPNQRIYPLYPGVQFRFDYGVFLLNKDVEFLLGRQGLRILDPRHTLPNLKYLLYVLTAGTGELPARKAGGVRGLIVGRGAPSLSRQVSEESMVSVGSEVGAFEADGDGKGKGKERVGSPGMSPNRNTLPFRSSGLREVA